MSSNSGRDERFSLRRWSQRKLEAARTEVTAPLQPASSVAAPATGQLPASSPGASAPAEAAAISASADAQLPAIESLTIDSDFAPFFRPQIDESIKRAALKQLFRDPRFNVMDGLDTYIDDYTQPDPIPPAMLDDLMQRRVFFAPSMDLEPRDDASQPMERDPIASSSDATPAPAEAMLSVAPAAVPAAPEAPTSPGPTAPAGSRPAVTSSGTNGSAGAAAQSSDAGAEAGNS